MKRRNSSTAVATIAALVFLGTGMASNPALAQVPGAPIENDTCVLLRPDETSLVGECHVLAASGVVCGQLYENVTFGKHLKLFCPGPCEGNGEDEYVLNIMPDGWNDVVSATFSGAPGTSFQLADCGLRLYEHVFREGDHVDCDRYCEDLTDRDFNDMTSSVGAYFVAN